GITVHLFDLNSAAVTEARASLKGIWERLTEKGRMGAADAAAALERVVACDTLDAMSDVGLVIEAVVERLDVKVDLFSKLESIVSEDCILASNTSSLSITRSEEPLVGYEQ